MPPDPPKFLPTRGARTCVRLLLHIHLLLQNLLTTLPMRSLAHTVPSRLVIPFGVWFSFNFGNTLFNLLFRFGSDSHSRCHSSCSKSLILFPKSEATIVFEASFSDRASFAASSASSLPFMPI